MGRKQKGKRPIDSASVELNIQKASISYSFALISGLFYASFIILAVALLANLPTFLYFISYISKS